MDARIQSCGPPCGRPIVRCGSVFEYVVRTPLARSRIQSWWWREEEEGVGGCVWCGSGSWGRESRLRATGVFVRIGETFRRPKRHAATAFFTFPRAPMHLASSDPGPPPAQPEMGNHSPSPSSYCWCCFPSPRHTVPTLLSSSPSHTSPVASTLSHLTRISHIRARGARGLVLSNPHVGAAPAVNARLSSTLPRPSHPIPAFGRRTPTCLTRKLKLGSHPHPPLPSPPKQQEPSTASPPPIPSSSPTITPTLNSTPMASSSPRRLYCAHVDLMNN